MVIRSLLLLAFGPLVYYLLSLYDIVEYFRRVPGYRRGMTLRLRR